MTQKGANDAEGEQVMPKFLGLKHYALWEFVYIADSTVAILSTENLKNFADQGPDFQKIIRFIT